MALMVSVPPSARACRSTRCSARKLSVDDRDKTQSLPAGQGRSRGWTAAKRAAAKRPIWAATESSKMTWALYRTWPKGYLMPAPRRMPWPVAESMRPLSQTTRPATGSRRTHATGKGSYQVRGGPSGRGARAQPQGRERPHPPQAGSRPSARVNTTAGEQAASAASRSGGARRAWRRGKRPLGQRERQQIEAASWLSPRPRRAARYSRT